MHFKLIIAFVDEGLTDAVMEAARKAGATGATIINKTRGEGLEETRTFLGLSLDVQRDMMLFLVEEHLSRKILEEIGRVGEFDDTPGTGIALQLDVEDALGVSRQMSELIERIEDDL